MSTSMVATAAKEQFLVLASSAVAAEIDRAFPGITCLASAAEFDSALPTVLIGDLPQLFHSSIRAAVEQDRVRVLYVLSGSEQLPAEAAGFPIFGFLSRPLHPRVLESMVKAAQENMLLFSGRERLERDLAKAFVEIDELNNIGAALSAERDTNKLFELILQKSREITRSDAGSLYLVDKDRKAAPRFCASP